MEEARKRTKKYYNYEFDIVVTEDGAHRWYETTSMCKTYDSFEKFAQAELLDLSDEAQWIQAQILHDQCGWLNPVCKWSTLLRKADKYFKAVA